MDPQEIAAKLDLARQYLAQQRVTFEAEPSGENLAQYAIAIGTMMEQFLDEASGALAASVES